MSSTSQPFRAGFVALVGMPNAGKSTLANILVGEKFTIVSRKPQTTRRRTLGVVNQPNSQIVLMDAPGVVRASKGLNQFLATEWEDVIASADALLLVLNIDGKSPDSADRLVEIAEKSGKPWVVAISKSDMPLTHRIGILQAKIGEKAPVVPVSAKSAPEAARDILIPMLASMMPESKAPLYDTDFYTTETQRDLVSELVREVCFEELREELPYSLAVKVRTFTERPNGMIHIAADILVEKENHKMIIVGKGANQLKTIGTLARVKIEELLGAKVFLELFVAHKPNWAYDHMSLKDLGYVVPR